MGEGERRIDRPTAAGGLISYRPAQAWRRGGTGRRIIGHEVLRARQSEGARKPRDGLEFLRIAVSRLIDQRIGCGIAPVQFVQHDGLARGGFVRQKLPIQRGQIGASVVAGQDLPQLFARQHPVKRFGKARRAAQLLVGLFGLAASDQRERLESLIARVRLITAIPEVDLPESLELPDKDQPILLSAIGAHATHLLTGDYAHFGKLYGSTIGGVLVLPPSEFLRNSMHAGR